MEIKLTLTLDEVNLILGALRELPYKIAADPHAKIANQAKAQVAEQEKAKHEEAAQTDEAQKS